MGTLKDGRVEWAVCNKLSSHVQQSSRKTVNGYYGLRDSSPGTNWDTFRVGSGMRSGLKEGNLLFRTSLNDGTVNASKRGAQMCGSNGFIYKYLTRGELQSMYEYCSEYMSTVEVHI